jgi:VWFA-related protein
MSANVKYLLICSRLLPLGLVLSIFGLFTSSVPAQSESREKPTPEIQEKPKLKHFGSSLDRLRWDPEKQTMVETVNPRAGRSVAADVDVIRVETDLVVFDVQVRDRQGHVVSGLNRDDFIVTENGGPQSIGHFSLGNDLSVSRSIVLIIDYSGSLRSYLDQSIDAAEVLISKLGPLDNMAIVTDDVELITDFTRDRERLRKTLESLRHKVKSRKYGLSFQFTALMATARELFNDEDIRPIIIFQTDGDEVGLLQPPNPLYYFVPFLPANLPSARKKSIETAVSKLEKTIAAQVKPYSLDDVYHAVEKSRATVYTVIPGTQLVGRSPAEQLSRVKLNNSLQYSEAQFEQIRNICVRAQTAAAGAAIESGGWVAFLDKPEQAADIYATILSDINSRYVIGYYPTNKVHDGRRRNVSIEVRQHPEYVISGRRSYYAPAAEQ